MITTIILEIVLNLLKSKLSYEQKTNPTENAKQNRAARFLSLSLSDIYCTVTKFKKKN